MITRVERERNKHTHTFRMNGREKAQCVDDGKYTWNKNTMIITKVEYEKIFQKHETQKFASMCCLNIFFMFLFYT